MMTDLAFYNTGCENARGLRRPLVSARRLVRRLLRPVFQHLETILRAANERLDDADRADAALRGDLDNLARRHDDLSGQLQATIAFGWDYVAMVRRLAVLEDRVESLTAAREAGPASVPFPAAGPRAEAG